MADEVTEGVLKIQLEDGRVFRAVGEHRVLEVERRIVALERTARIAKERELMLLAEFRSRDPGANC